MKKSIEDIKAISIVACRGIGQEDQQDITNSLYIAKRLGKINIPFGYRDFSGIGVRGVESSRIDCLLALQDNKIAEVARGIREYELNPEEKKLYKVADYLSKLSSEKLGAFAQYFFDKSCGNNGGVHLYPVEAKLARKLKDVIEMDVLEKKKENVKTD